LRQVGSWQGRPGPARQKNWRRGRNCSYQKSNSNAFEERGSIKGEVGSKMVESKKKNSFPVKEEPRKEDSDGVAKKSQGKHVEGEKKTFGGKEGKARPASV